MTALNTLAKFMITIVIIILVTVGFYVMDWTAKMKEIKTLQETLAQKEGVLESNERAVSQLPQLRQDKIRLEGELRAIVQEKLGSETEAEFVPNYLESIENMVFIERSRTGDNSFNLVSLTPGAQQGGNQPQEGQKQEQTGGSDVLASYPTRKFQMAMEGKYSTVIDFLQQLARMEMKRLVTIDSITLSPGGSAGAVNSGPSPMLNIQIPVTAYLSTGGVQ